jgi:acetyl-CoA C-acetyltransferase
MIQTAIAGVGMTAVSEHWGRSLVELAKEAAQKALEASNDARIDALFVANSYGSVFNKQSQLGPLLAESLGLTGVEAFTVEAGTASGGAAVRAAHLAVLSGQIKTALVIGVEKVTDVVGSERTRALSIELDADTEAIHGATLPAMAALLMRRYMHEYDLKLSAFEGFSINAHANGKRNPFAMYRNALKVGAFANAPMIAEPVSLFDSAPEGDGAAALVLTSYDRAEDLNAAPVRIAASAASTDTLALERRANMLHLSAVERSVEHALQQADITRDDLDLLELHDAFTILNVLSLEASGFSAPGEGWQWAADGGQRISLTGDLPINTFGGLKSRGNPAGAAGVYQIVEACLQLRGAASDNQVPDARWVMCQNLGGLGSTAVTHVLTL